MQAQLCGSNVVDGDFGKNGLVLEDLDRKPFDEQSLFHLFNLSREQGFCILMTARSAPARWSVELPDLVSRMRALPVATNWRSG